MVNNNQMNMGQPVMNNQNQNQNPQMFVQAGGGGTMSTHRGGGGYGMWLPPQNPTGSGVLSGVSMGQRSKNSWKNKKGLNNDKWNSNKTMIGGNSSNSGGYNPPTLKELQQQNRLKARRYFPKKKYNHGGRSAPFAPRNTTSFLIRAKKAGGITSLVSPCPVTPAVLPTPIFSPSREVLVDMAKEEWGVDGYGSMKGLIRLRSPGNGNEGEAGEEDEEDEGGDSSESDVEEHVEVERRLDHDLSRFEMIYPNYSGVDHTSYNLENRVDDQDTHIAQLEEENLILKERLFLMEREFDDLRMRLQSLERRSMGVTERVNNEEVVENDSENESESSRGYGPSMEDNNDVMQENIERSQNSEDNNNADVEFKQSDSSIEKGMQEIEHGTNVTTDVCMEQDDNEIETEKENNNEAIAEDDDQKHVVEFSTKEVEDTNKGLAKDE